MNPFLKAAIDEACDIEAAGEAAVAKRWTGLFSDLLKAGEDAPALIANLSDAKAELQAVLTNPSSDADLLAYVASKTSSANPAAAAVIYASADLLLTTGLKTYALILAIKTAKGTAPAAAPVAPAST